MNRTDVLDAVQTALALANVDAPALVRRANWPDGAEQVLVLDVVSSRPFGYEQDYAHVIQVSAYAPTTLAAEALNQTASAALTAAGFIPGVTRPAPDDQSGWDGVITDWRQP